MRTSIIVGSILALASGPITGQQVAIGGHGGVDVSDRLVTELLGLEVAWPVSPRVQIRGLGTMEMEEPGSKVFLAGAVQWQPVDWRVHPYLGVGATMVGQSPASSRTIRGGWFLAGGVEARTGIGTPYLEVRLYGVGPVSEHVLVGLRLVP